jgi:hypothetical protein
MPRLHGTTSFARRPAAAGATPLATIDVLPALGDFGLPVIVVPPTLTSATRPPARSALSNPLYGTAATAYRIRANADVAFDGGRRWVFRPPGGSANRLRGA